MANLILLALPMSLFFAPGTASDDSGARGERRGKIMKLDTNGDGAISLAEAEGTRLAKNFDKFDTNGDDKITKEEFKAAHKGHRGKHRSPEQKFARLDANSDGKVTLAELETAHAEREQRRADSGKSDQTHRPRFTPQQKFAKLDLNSDGGITLDEMKAAREKWAKAKHSK